MTTSILLPVNLAAFLFHHDHDETGLVVEHVALDEAGLVHDFTLVSPTPERADRTVDALRDLYLDAGEGAVRERLGLPALPLRVWDDDCDWYIAISPADASAAQARFLGDSFTLIDATAEKWTAFPDDKELTISEGEPGTEPSTTKTCAEWVKEKGQRGFLATTEF